MHVHPGPSFSSHVHAGRPPDYPTAPGDPRVVRPEHQGSSQLRNHLVPNEISLIICFCAYFYCRILAKPNLSGTGSGFDCLSFELLHD